MNCFRRRFSSHEGDQVTLVVENNCYIASMPAAFDYRRSDSCLLRNLCNIEVRSTATCGCSVTKRRDGRLADASRN